MNSRLLRIKEVIKRTGLGRSTIYGLIPKGEFPKQIRITERCVGWDEDEIQKWISSKLAQSKKKDVVNV